jgi:hypothetical protein
LDNTVLSKGLLCSRAVSCFRMRWFLCMVREGMLLMKCV